MNYKNPLTWSHVKSNNHSISLLRKLKLRSHITPNNKYYKRKKKRYYNIHRNEMLMESHRKPISDTAIKIGDNQFREKISDNRSHLWTFKSFFSLSALFFFFEDCSANFFTLSAFCLFCLLFFTTHSLCPSHYLRHTFYISKLK